MRERSILAFAIAACSAGALATGCSGPNDQALASLEAEVRRLRSDQDRMASQIDQISSRLVLTEDTARSARNAVEGDDRRRVISLGTDRPRSEPIRVDNTTRDPNQPDEGDPSNRPTIRVSRGDRPADPAGFSVLPPTERLPVVPAPPLPSMGLPPPPPGRAPGAPAQQATPPGGARGPGASLDAPMVPVTEGSGTLDPRALTAYDGALAMARSGRCREAVDAFGDFLTRWPEHPHADNAMYWRAECILQGGDRHRAVQEFEGLVARFPAGNKVADALYKLAVTYRRLGDRAAADRAAQRLNVEFPDSEAARRIRGERE